MLETQYILGNVITEYLRELDREGTKCQVRLQTQVGWSQWFDLHDWEVGFAPNYTDGTPPRYIIVTDNEGHTFVFPVDTILCYEEKM